MTAARSGSARSPPKGPISPRDRKPRPGGEGGGGAGAGAEVGGRGGPGSRRLRLSHVGPLGAAAGQSRLLERDAPSAAHGLLRDLLPDDLGDARSFAWLRA